jgi:hypothetical protein
VALLLAERHEVRQCLFNAAASRGVAAHPLDDRASGREAAQHREEVGSLFEEASRKWRARVSVGNGVVAGAGAEDD